MSDWQALYRHEQEQRVAAERNLARVQAKLNEVFAQLAEVKDEVFRVWKHVATTAENLASGAKQ